MCEHVYRMEPAGRMWENVIYSWFFSILIMWVQIWRNCWEEYVHRWPPPPSLMELLLPLPLYSSGASSALLLVKKHGHKTGVYCWENGPLWSLPHYEKSIRTTSRWNRTFFLLVVDTPAATCWKVSYYHLVMKFDFVFFHKLYITYSISSLTTACQRVTYSFFLLCSKHCNVLKSRLCVLPPSPPPCFFAFFRIYFKLRYNSNCGVIVF